MGSQDFNILFTCGGRRVVLLQAFRRALKSLGLTGRVFVTDMSSATAAFGFADKGFTVPPVGTIEYMPALRQICREQDIKLVVPLTDLDLRSLARQQHTFTELGVRIMIGSSEAIMKCIDKTRCSQFLSSIGLGAIRTFALEDFRREPFFPCFIKPVRGSASIGTALLHSEAELRGHLATFGDLMLIQDYIPGAEYTLDIYRTAEGEVKCVVPRQRLAIRSGEVEKGVTVADQELIDVGAYLGSKLEGMWGVINAQCRRPQGGKPHIFEINPRFGGGAPLSIAAGADLPRYVLEEVRGLPVSAKLGQFQPNLLMLRYDEAYFTPVQDITKLPGYDSPKKR